MVSRRLALTALGTVPVAASLAIPMGATAATVERAHRHMAGNLDLDQLPVVDSHMHPIGRKLISQAYAGLMGDFVKVLVPPGEYAGKSDLLAHARAGVNDLVMSAPRRTAYFNYIARTYGVAPTIEGFDSVVSKHIASDAEFQSYVKTVFDRERIATVVLQAAEPAPTPPATLIPPDRYVWTTVISEMTRLRWIKAQGLTSLTDAVAAIDRILESAVERGARGFKNMSAYYRTLGLTRPSQPEAEAALHRVLKAAPSADSPEPPGPMDPNPTFADPADNAALTTLEDYLFRHIYIKAGRLRRPIIIHSAVALHPALRADYNDPHPLYAIFIDPEIQRAETRFVIIHAGYPNTELIAAFISQFPNVYTDVSFYSKYPGTLLQVYRDLLALGPSDHIMHGSDANSVPEEIGSCAWNSRAVLAKVLTEYLDLGWTQGDINKMAEDVLHRTARTVFGIET
ncbi:MAG TPA: amidohydrolase family protein [Steroidobacteraceae bacterium]|nr:amidohydrolase family protein [Steroidobacteraceae bacterium]